MSCIKAIIKVRIYKTLCKQRTRLKQDTWKLIMFMEVKITNRQQFRSHWQMFFYLILKKQMHKKIRKDKKVHIKTNIKNEKNFYKK